MRTVWQFKVVLLAAAFCGCLSSVAMADLIITSGTQESPYVISSAQDVSQTGSPYLFRVGTSAGTGVASIDSGGSVYNSVSDAGFTSIGSSGEGMLLLNGGTLYTAGSPRIVRVGSTGTGALVINSGTAYATYVQVGYGDAWGDVVVNGGTLNASDRILIGMLAGGFAGGGHIKLNGGTIVASKNVEIGYAGGTGPCTLEISGGTFSQTGSSSDVCVGTSTSAGTLHVNGSGATAITVADRVYGYAGYSTLKFTVDAGGVTPISVNYTYANLNGTVDMELASGVTPATDETFDLIVTRTGTMTSNLALAAGDEELWELEVAGGTTLRARYLGPSGVEPPVADAGSDSAVEDSDDSGTETVTLDGSASTDDAGIVSYVWKDYNGNQIATGATASVSLPLGINDIMLVVTDGNGQSDTDVVRVWVYPDVDYWVDGTTGSNANPGTSAGQAWATIDYAVDHVSAGKVIMVKEGIYREQVTMGVSGASGSPITLMGKPFDRVVVSGADVVTGWTQCTSAIADGNPNYANIYYVDLPWKTTRVIQDGVELAVSRTPGWYVCTGGTTTTLTDTVNLTQPDGYWVGATVFLWSTAHRSRQVTAFSSATSTLTVSSSFGFTPRAGQDRFCLTHLVSLINGAGQWAVKDLGGGTYRLFVWADGGGDPDTHTMEASRRLIGISTSSKTHLCIDNLEVRHTQGNGITNSGNPANHHLTIQQCIVHGNDVHGIGGAFTDSTLRRNLVFNNSAFGINAICPSNLVFEENEVAFNQDDGLDIGGSGSPALWYENIVVRRNSIHHQNRWGHPDSTMIWNYVRGVTLECNLFFAAGQHMQGSNIDGLTMTNNAMCGSYAPAVNLGGIPVHMVARRNTIIMSALTPISHGSDGYDYENNILVVGNPSNCWANVEPASDYASDYNHFWNGPGLTATPVVWDSHWSWTLQQYAAASGHDTHSSYSDPQLANAPMYLLALDTEARQDEYTTTKVYLWSRYAPDYFQVGDHVEIDSDGVVRTVTSVGSDYVTFTPGDDYIAIKCNTIANWGENTNYAVDITPQAAITGSDSQPVGSTINVQEFLAGDFNGDGRRDVPEYPQPDE